MHIILFKLDFQKTCFCSFTPDQNIGIGEGQEVCVIWTERVGGGGGGRGLLLLSFLTEDCFPVLFRKLL